MAQSQKPSFTVNASTDEALIERLLELAGFTKERFISYMDTTADIMAQNPKWAVRYLEDVIDANLTHLGYVMKDTKTMGMLGEYNNQQTRLIEIINNVDGLQKPVIINEEEIVREDGSLKISYIAHAEAILRDFNDAHDTDIA